MPKDDKSQFLARAGYTLDTWQQLEQDLRTQVLTQPAELIEVNRYAEKYAIRACLRGVNGVEFNILTIWMVAKRYDQICHLSARQRSQFMKVQHPLFSQVALAQDLPEHNLKRGDIATIVEHYPMPEGEEDVPQVTLEVAASQILPIAQWQQEEMILRKLRQLSKSRLLQLEDYLDFLLQKEKSENVSA